MWSCCPGAQALPYRDAPRPARWSPQLEERPGGAGGGLVASGARRGGVEQLPSASGSGAEPRPPEAYVTTLSGGRRSGSGRASVPAGSSASARRGPPAGERDRHRARRAAPARLDPI